MLPRRDHLDGLGIGLLVGCCLFWGFQQVLVKATIPQVAPVLQASLRFVFATVLLLAWSAARGVPLFERDATLRAGLLAGALFTVECVGIYLGLQYTSVSRLTIFLYCAPFWLALILPMFIGAERLRSVQWIGLAVAFAGVFLATAHGDADARTSTWLGDLLGIVAGAAWGLTTVVIRISKLSGVSAEKLLLYQIGVSAVVMPPLSLALGESWHVPATAFVVTSLVVQTVVGAFGSYLIWMWMIRHYPVTKMSSFTFLTPVSAVVLGVVLLGEPVGMPLVVALVCVAAGIVLVNRRRPVS